MRSAGILMPISALPSPYGIGTLGQAAREFVEFLKNSGQSYWQILPICPTGYGDSPYQPFSSYAGNPYFVDLDDLADCGLLLPEEYCHINWGDNPASIDYGILYEKRFKILRLAYRRFLNNIPEDFDSFCQEQAAWLDDYALYMTLKSKNGGISWFEWPCEERLRNTEAMMKTRTELREEIVFWQMVQYLFFKQWGALKALANENGILIIGDLPIYVAGDSADVWAAPEQFQLDSAGWPTEVAGCPPDGFSPKGQLWGNPLFNWERMEKEGFDWWIRRIEFQFRVYDVLRIDHFRGFDSYYAIPSGEETAENGRWRCGPGMGFFQAVTEKLGPRSIIAEDLGFLTPSVIQMLEATGYPGMKVLEFAFDGCDGEGNAYLPHNYSKNCVVYTGTHDNDTVLGWMKNAPSEEVAFAKKYLCLCEDEGYNWGMMRGAWASVAELAVMQMQDLLGLGTEARMNKPSTLGKNWKWRALSADFNKPLAEKIHSDMATYGRLPRAKDN